MTVSNDLYETTHILVGKRLSFRKRSVLSDRKRVIFTTERMIRKQIQRFDQLEWPPHQHEPGFSQYDV